MTPVEVGHAVAAHDEHAAARGEPLRVMLQTESLDVGGLERVVASLALHLGPPSQVTVVTRRAGAVARELVGQGVRVVEILGARERHRALLEEVRPHVLSSHFSYTDLDLATALAIPVVETVHAPYTWLGPDDERALVAAAAHTTHHVAVSPAVLRFHRDRFGIAPTAMSVITNGLDPHGLTPTRSRADSRRALGLAEDDRVFLHVGSISLLKHHHLLVSAIAALRARIDRVRLVCAGPAMDPELDAALRRRTVDEGLGDHVRWVGGQDRAALADLYTMADAFVLGSLQEGWSLAAMEALYFGLPLVLTDVGGARALVRDDDVGLVVPAAHPDFAALGQDEMIRLGLERRPANLPALTAAMARVVDDLPGWRLRAARGRQRVIEELGVAAMGQRYLQRFGRVVAGTGGAAGLR